MKKNILVAVLVSLSAVLGLQGGLAITKFENNTDSNVQLTIKSGDRTTVTLLPKGPFGSVTLSSCDNTFTFRKTAGSGNGQAIVIRPNCNITQVIIASDVSAPQGFTVLTNSN